MRQTRILHLALLTCICLATTAAAQTPSITWGEPLKFKLNQGYRRKMSPLGRIGKTTYVQILELQSFRYPKEMRILGYDSKMKVTSDYIAPIPDLGKTTMYVRSYVRDSKIYFLYKEIDKRKKEYAYHVQCYNPKTNMNEEVRELGRYDLPKTGTTDAADNDTEVKVRVSPDSSSLLLWNELPSSEKESKKFTITIMAPDFSKVFWSKTAALPVKDANSWVEEIIHTNDNHIYLVVGSHTPGSRGKSSYYSYTVYGYGKDQHTPSVTKINLPKVEIESIYFDFSPKQQVLRCSALYSEDEKGVNNQFLLYKYDLKTQQLLTSTKKKIDNLYRTTTKSKDKLKFVIRDIVPRDDGGQLIVAEQSKELVGTKGEFFYEYGSVAYIVVSESGEIEMVRSVPKHQRGSTTIYAGHFCSIGVLTYQDKLLVMYNDHPKNVTQTTESEDDVKKMRANRELNPAGVLFLPLLFVGARGGIDNMALVMATLTQDGQARKQIISNNKEEKYFVMPPATRPISENEYLLIAFDNNEMRLGLLELK